MENPPRHRGGFFAHSPAECNRKIARSIGDPAQRPVGADASVRPWGNDKFAATFRKNGRAPCGSMRRPQASFEAQPRAARLLAPKMGIDPYKRVTDSHWCVRVCGYIPPGGQGRPPLRVRAVSHWRVRFCGVVQPGGASPSPTLRRNAPHLKTYHPSPHPALRATFPTWGRLWRVRSKLSLSTAGY